ncbi:MAG: two-component system, NarL family, invasion response regulator UvrY [Solirubrobacteraceae bacterium]|nr:two-component system, NarL family, invasion response regulator UvrY [Solirubrobacteraceae bacterium]
MDEFARDENQPVVRVLVVDDQRQFLEVAAELIGAAPGFEAAGSARSAEAALEWLRRDEADLLLMDVRMPGCDGVRAARRVTEDGTAAVIVLVSSDPWPEIAADPAGHGVHAFCRKEALRPALLQRLWMEHRPPSRAPI